MAKFIKNKDNGKFFIYFSKNILDKCQKERHKKNICLFVPEVVLL